jgi:hypothetical protein
MYIVFDRRSMQSVSDCSAAVCTITWLAASNAGASANGANGQILLDIITLCI